MAERVFPACRRSPLFLSFPFFFLVSLFFFFVLSPFCPAPGQRRYICLPFSCAAGLLIIHSRANIVSVRIVTHPANRKIQFFSRCLSFLRPPRVFTSLKQRETKRQRERESHAINFPVEDRYRCFSPPSSWNSRWAILLSLLLRTNGKIDSSPRKFEFLCDPRKVLEGGLREWGRWREKFAGRMDIDGIGHRKNVTVIGAILLEIRLLPLRCIFVWQMDQFFFPSWKTCPNTLSIVYELCVHFYFISKLSINYFHSFF